MDVGVYVAREEVVLVDGIKTTKADILNLSYLKKMRLTYAETFAYNLWCLIEKSYPIKHISSCYS